MANVKKIVLLLTVLMMVVSGCAQNEENPTETPSVELVSGSYQDIASSFMIDIQEENYESINTRYSYDEAMQEFVDNDELVNGFKSLITSAGAVIEIQTISEVVQGDFVIVQVPVILEKDQLIVNVVFDEERKIAGVNFAEYVEPSKEVVSPIELPSKAEEIDMPLIMRDGKELPGTLTIPQSEEPGPLVILVHGSGPNDRDETIYGNTVFKDIAYLLAQEGIASYRYDKRTLVYNEELIGDYDFTVYDETIYDVVDIVSILKSNEEISASEIYILGHSLGGYCIPRIAQLTEVAGYIMMAAPASDLRTLMEYQYNYLSQFQEDKTAFNEAINALSKLDDIDALSEEEFIMGSYSAYWQDILNYDVLLESDAIDVKTLVLQGEEDYQVPMSEFNMWKQHHENNELWTFISYEGLSHLMMPGNLGEDPTEYYMIRNNVNSEVTKDIASFILE